MCEKESGALNFDDIIDKIISAEVGSSLIINYDRKPSEKYENNYLFQPCQKWIRKMENDVYILFVYNVHNYIINGIDVKVSAKELKTMTIEPLPIISIDEISNNILI